MDASAWLRTRIVFAKECEVDEIKAIRSESEGEGKRAKLGRKEWNGIDNW